MFTGIPDHPGGGTGFPGTGFPGDARFSGAIGDDVIVVAGLVTILLFAMHIRP